MELIQEALFVGREAPLVIELHLELLEGVGGALGAHLGDAELVLHILNLEATGVAHLALELNFRAKVLYLCVFGAEVGDLGGEIGDDSAEAIFFEIALNWFVGLEVNWLWQANRPCLAQFPPLQLLRVCRKLAHKRFWI